MMQRNGAFQQDTVNISSLFNSDKQQGCNDSYILSTVSFVSFPGKHPKKIFGM